MPTKALAIDPGGSTGVACLFDNGIIGTATIPSHDGDISSVVKFILEKQPSVIIVERFTGQGNMSRYGIETVELIGAIKTLVMLATELPGWPFMELIRRMPGQRMVQVPAATRILKQRREEHKIRYTDHEVSALAHLLGWMNRQNKLEHNSD